MQNREDFLKMRKDFWNYIMFKHFCMTKMAPVFKLRSETIEIDRCVDLKNTTLRKFTSLSNFQNIKIYQNQFTELGCDSHFTSFMQRYSWCPRSDSVFQRCNYRCPTLNSTDFVDCKWALASFTMRWLEAPANRNRLCNSRSFISMKNRGVRNF